MNKKLRVLDLTGLLGLPGTGRDAIFPVFNSFLDDESGLQSSVVKTCHWALSTSVFLFGLISTFSTLVSSENVYHMRVGNSCNEITGNSGYS